MINIKGLTNEEVKEKRLKYGSNAINIKSENRFVKLFIASLGDPIIKIMLIALIIRVVLMFRDNSWYETLGMLISILLSSLISSLSEYGSNKTFRLIEEKYRKVKTKVIRNNNIEIVNIDDIVVDDLVSLEAGDLIPADGIVVEGFITTDEKVITGEAKEVNKEINSKVYRGTVVISDRCIMKVTNVGEKTLMGNITTSINTNDTSPMKERLTKLAKTISRIGYIGAFLSVVAYLFNVLFISNNYDLEIIKELITDIPYMIDLLIHSVTLGLTILLVVVPEGLPMMSALVLSSNMKRMQRNNVLVRKPIGIETSGGINVLLTDKTGTLTVGNLNVIGIIDYDDNHYGSISLMPNNYKNILIDSLNYNNNSLYENNLIIGSNQTDKSILSFIGKHEKNISIISKINFNSNNKYSSVTLENNKTYYKGSYEKLIDKCLYYYDKDGIKHILKNRSKLDDILKKYSKKGYRVLITIENNIFIGFILIKDEIRKESYESLKKIKEAGIDVIMITGDDKNTATSIAEELNMINNKSLILTHDEIDKMSDEDIYNNYKYIKVIARALPQDKARIAKLLKKYDLTIGMTGDGVNDAPALKISDVGFALGSGSEVAKEASDIVILDDNIKSITNAILYGRLVFKSIRKFIIFQLTMNVSALILSIVGPLIGITSPVTVMQMLWINMIMDTLAGLAYSYEVPQNRFMLERPIKRSEKIINKYMYITIMLISIYISTLLISIIKVDILRNLFRPNNNYLMTAFFSVFIFTSIFNAFNARSERINIFAGILKNKVFLIIMSLIFISQLYLIYSGGELFRTFGLTISEFTIVMILSISVIPLDILKKLIIKIKS